MAGDSISDKSAAPTRLALGTTGAGDRPRATALPRVGLPRGQTEDLRVSRLEKHDEATLRDLPQRNVGPVVCFSPKRTL